jgi:hypothetical protein
VKLFSGNRADRLVSINLMRHCMCCALEICAFWLTVKHYTLRFSVTKYILQCLQLKNVIKIVVINRSEYRLRQGIGNGSSIYRTHNICYNFICHHVINLQKTNLSTWLVVTDEVTCVTVLPWLQLTYYYCRNGGVNGSGKKYDLTKWKYTDLRDAINTTTGLS